jgi:hypothetical protein
MIVIDASAMIEASWAATPTTTCSTPSRPASTPRTCSTWKSAWELVLEAAESLTTRGLVEFTRAQLLDEVRRRDASRRPESLGPVIQGMTANASGGPPSPCGTPLVRVGGVYRPYAGRVRTLRRIVPSAAFDKQIRKLNRLAR